MPQLPRPRAWRTLRRMLAGKTRGLTGQKLSQRSVRVGGDDRVRTHCVSAEQLSDHEQIKRAILGMARGNPDYKPGDGNGAALAPPTAPADGENQP